MKLTATIRRKFRIRNKLKVSSADRLSYYYKIYKISLLG